MELIKLRDVKSSEAFEYLDILFGVTATIDDILTFDTELVANAVNSFLDSTIGLQELVEIVEPIISNRPILLADLELGTEYLTHLGIIKLEC